MPKIYEYFGLIFYFYSNDHLPIHVHVTKAERETIYEIIVENGLLVDVLARKSIKKPLTTKEHNDVIAFISLYYSEIINKWVDFFVNHTSVKNTKITKKI